MHRYSPRAVPAQDRYGQQGERGLAAEDHGGPGHADGIGAAKPARDPRGSRWLRTELAGWLARTRGLRADPDDIIVVTGVAQALALLARVLRNLGEIAVEDPGSRGSRDELAYWGLRPVPVTGSESMTWHAATCGRCCSRPCTSSPPASCWPRGAAATCWTGPPGPMPSAAGGTRDRSGIRRAPP